MAVQKFIWTCAFCGYATTPEDRESIEALRIEHLQFHVEEFLDELSEQQ